MTNCDMEVNVRIRSFFGSYFPAYRQHTEIYLVNFRIQSEYGKMWTRKTNTDHFYAVSISLVLVV